VSEKRGRIEYLRAVGESFAFGIESAKVHGDGKLVADTLQSTPPRINFPELEVAGSIPVSSSS